jgi:hypothetical protein
VGFLLLVAACIFFLPALWNDKAYLSYRSGKAVFEGAPYLHAIYHAGIDPDLERLHFTDRRRALGLPVELSEDAYFDTALEADLAAGCRSGSWGPWWRSGTASSTPTSDG